MSRLFSFSLLVGLVLTIVNLICWLTGSEYINEGPSKWVALAAKSLWEDGSLNVKEYNSLLQPVFAQSKLSGGLYWQDVTAIGKGGELYPKHSLLSVILGSLFYGIFGQVGFLILNTLLAWICAICIYDVAQSFTSKDLRIPALLGLFGLSQFPGYIYGYSYDLHGTSIMLLGVALGRQFSFLGGVIFSLSLFVRPSHLLLFACALVFAKSPLRAFLGLLSGAVIFGASNFMLFGAPLTTAYNRLPFIKDGRFGYLYDHPIGANLTTLWSNWDQKLFGVWNGLITANSFLIVGLFFIRVRQRKFQLIILNAFIYALFIFSYPFWNTSLIGNRFLLPSIALVLMCYLGSLERRRLL